MDRPQPPHHDSTAGTVVVVEPVALFAHGLQRIIERWRPGSGIRRLESAAALRRAADHEVEAAVLLVLGPGLLAATAVLADLPDPLPLPVVAAVDPRVPVSYSALLESGMRSLWDATSPEAGFGSAAEAALAGDEWVSPSLGSSLVRSVGVRLGEVRGRESASLTSREREILQMLSQGLTNRTIAEMLFISENTVKNHVRSILEKLQAGSRTEAVVLAARSGLLDLGSPARQGSR